MESDIIQRITRYCSESNLSNNRLSGLIGIGQKTVNNYMNGSRKVSYEFIEALVRTFEDINSDWLITGEGFMLKSDSSLTDRTKESTAIDKEQDSSAIYERMIEKKDKRIEELALMVGSLQKEVEILKQDKKIVLESDDASNAVERLILTGTDDR